MTAASEALDVAALRVLVATMHAERAPAFGPVPGDWIVRSCLAHLWDNVALCVALVWGAEGDRWPDADWRGYAARCDAETA